MKKYYPYGVAFLVICITIFSPEIIFSQTCTTVGASYITTESRCAATGTVKINATGGSGNYQYKVTGPVNTSYTSASLITGLSAGKYLITIKDITLNCVYAKDSVTIGGNYLAPTFGLTPTGVSCINGNDGKITTIGLTFGRAPFSYKIIAPSASKVGTVSATGNFTGLLSGNYLIQLSDSCGALQTRSTTIDNYDWSINSYTVTKKGCDTITVTLKLTDNKGNVTPNAVFNGFKYGASVTAGDTSWFITNVFNYYKGNKHSVKLFVKDGCGNIKSVVWTDASIPDVNGTVSISNKACSTFIANITGQKNLTAPNYCIYNSSNVLISCNTTATFNGLPYGSYCIKITDNCYDTTITRCFTVARPIPSVDLNVTIAATCKSFTATVTGQTNLYNPNYCLYNAANVLLGCNTTGIFTNLAFGTYCIKIFNDPACYDTTITRCFSVSKPVPSINSIVGISNLSCSTFTATITDTANWNNPQFCLYTPAHILIVCNSTGVFNNLTFGTYCIDVVNGSGCYDTTITRCFTVTRPKPFVNSAVAISNKNCTDFTAAITGQANINNPQYCLYNNLNILVSCNTAGVFTNIPYGNYCIKLQNDKLCYDTVITRCFAEAFIITDISISTRKSCTTIGTSELKVTIKTGNPVYTLKLFSPTGILLQTVTTASNSYTFLNIAALASPLKYKIVVTDQCGSKDSSSIAPVVSIAKRVITINSKCPSGIWPDGAADILINITNNNIGGNISPKIIKKNGSVVSVNPTSGTGYNYTFLNLGPATYIFDTYIEDCSKHVYDTVQVSLYFYPFLTGSSAYQCDNNGFSLSVNVQGGVAPYTYEIIGSVPASPSLITPPQASPIFSVNNGTAYSLVRVRAIDGCGNAALYDVSVLPLANFLVYEHTPECFNQSLTLQVDSIANATFTWYKRIVPADSIFVGTGSLLYFSNLQLSDTGMYFCKIVLNNGCVIRYANHRITGSCYAVLVNDIVLSGSKQPDGNILYWNREISGIKEYSLQRASENSVVFNTIYTEVNSSGGSNLFFDKTPFNGNNIYRLKLNLADNTIKYSNSILIRNNNIDISFYPNPINNILYISLTNKLPKNYSIRISDFVGHSVMQKNYYNIQNKIINYPKSQAISSGIYLLTITDLGNNEKHTYKIVYK